MLSRLRDIKVILAIVLVLSWILAASLGFVWYSSTHKKMDQKEATITQLNKDIQNIGQLVNVFAVNADVPMGKKVEDGDYVTVQVPVGAATNLVQDASEILGHTYKVALTAGTVISKDVIMNSDITDDMRLYDLVLNSIPVGLKVGSYVDVRISLPMGEDFIAIPHKRVYAINAGVIKLAINENDIHAYNSMLIDSLLYPGTNLYAIEYLEGGAQKAADAFYPVSTNILAVAQKDPNLLEAIKSDMLKRRQVLDSDLSSLQSQDTQQKENLDVILERGREKYRDYMSEAARAAERNEELAKEQAANDAAAGVAPNGQ